jgi:hypothetical protein
VYEKGVELTVGEAATVNVKVGETERRGEERRRERQGERGKGEQGTGE